MDGRRTRSLLITGGDPSLEERTVVSFTAPRKKVRHQMRSGSGQGIMGARRATRLALDDVDDILTHEHEWVEGSGSVGVNGSGRESGRESKRDWLFSPTS
jgi:hypothetical protein